MSLRDLVLNGGVPQPFEHWPDGDLYDPVSCSQAYFHVHRDGENGHFHLFMRPGGMPPGMHPVAAAIRDRDAPCHLGAVELDDRGRPCALFATNRWVTGEAWYAAVDAARLLDRFQLVLPGARAELGRRLTHLVRANRAVLVDLLTQRDSGLEQWRRDHPDVDVYDDEGLEIIARVVLA